jgi:hypothetical protein
MPVLQTPANPCNALFLPYKEGVAGSNPASPTYKLPANCDIIQPEGRRTKILHSKLCKYQPLAPMEERIAPLACVSTKSVAEYVLLGDRAKDFDGILHVEALKECCPDQWDQTFLRGDG